MKFTPTMVATLIGAAFSIGALSSCTSSDQASTINVTESQLENDINTVVKSQNDDRTYRYITLDNGLKVILVSDSKADKSAASMDVHIGHMADPKDREGLTHFLEHMLFLGTDKYPKVGEYSEYLKANGGWSNAGTGQEHTNYFFQVNQDAFEEATDRFAQFFISPSLDKEYVDREKNAVHSEYSMKIKDDARRIREVLKDTTNQDHPSSQFSVGNLDTLADRENDLLIDDLKAQYKKYYSSSRMALSLVGREDLDTLEQWAREKFSAIPNNGSKSTPSKIAPYLPEQLGVNISIVPMKDVRTLTVYFPVPNSGKYLQEKPLNFLVSIVGQEAEGSLFSYLKGKGLIESLSTNAYGPDDFEQFSVTINLTPKGLEQYQDVNAAIFSYFELLKDETKNQLYFNELNAIAKTNFDFKEKGSAANTASFLSNQLQYYKPKNILNADYLYTQYSHELLLDYLSKLTPENMRQVLVAKGLKTDHVQPEYDTPYAMSKLSDGEIARYNNPQVISNLSLPAVNPFIATHLALKAAETITEHPSVVFEKPGFKFWHKQDTEFNIPKADVYVQIYSEQAGKDVSSRAKNYLYNALLNDSLNEFGYPAKAAGLNYNMWSTASGMGFGVSGYDEKQADLLSTINNRIRNLTIDEAEFILHKNRLIRSWNNAKFERPYSQASSALSQLQYEKAYGKFAMANALTSVTIEELQQYVTDFHQAVEIEILAHGNMLKADSIKLAQTLYTLNMKESTAKSRADKVIYLNKTDHSLTLEIEVDHNDSTIVASYINADSSLENRAKYGLLGSMLNAPFYKQIRTEQQLGYIVSGRNTLLEENPGLSFLIQSPKAGPVELMRRVNQFMADYKDTLSEMTDKEFSEYKQGLIKSILAKHKNLGERTSYYWKEINDKAVNFDSNDKMVAQISALTKDEMNQFLNTTVVNTKPILVRSFGTAHRNDDDYKQSKTDESICRDAACVNNQLTSLTIK
jgi:secreted Zn-dependent insulinase-like peptidase